MLHKYYHFILPAYKKTHVYYLPDSSIFHDRNVKVMQNTDNDPFPVGLARCVVISLNINQNLKTVLQTIFGKRLHEPAQYKKIDGLGVRTSFKTNVDGARICLVLGAKIVETTFGFPK